MTIRWIVSLLFGIVPSHALPIWNHPNVSAALPVTVSVVDELTVFEEALAQQAPQSFIWTDNTLVGYFANEWRAPIWTTVNQDPYNTAAALALEFADGPDLSEVIPPGGQTGGGGPFDFDNGNGSGTGGGSGSGGGTGTGGGTGGILPPFRDPSDPFLTVPEPGFLSLWPAGAAYAAGWAWRRRKRYGQVRSIWR
jgi:uncharacterized membrane protein YgcG